MAVYFLGLSEATRSPSLWQKVAETAPSDGQVLTWVAANGQWEPQTPSSGGIPNPGTKASGDLLQYNGSAWDAKGAASGDRLTGPLYGSAVDLAGNLTFTADNTYDIGASGATRPRSVYAGTDVWAGASARLRADRLHLPVAAAPGSLVGGDIWVAPAIGADNVWYYDGTAGTSRVLLRDQSPASGDLTGTYPGPTVAKIQGDAVSTTNPSNNQALVWTGSQYDPKEVGWFSIYSGAVSAVQTVTVDSLNGGTNVMYRIVIHGTWSSTGAQRYIYLVPRTGAGSDQTTNQYCHRHYAGNEPGIGTAHGVTSVASRLILHMNDWDQSQDIMIDALFFAATGYSNRRVISHTAQETTGQTGAGEKGKYLESIYHSVWRDSTTAIGGLKIDFNSVNFSGYVQIWAKKIA